MGYKTFLENVEIRQKECYKKEKNFLVCGVFFFEKKYCENNEKNENLLCYSNISENISKRIDNNNLLKRSI